VRALSAPGGEAILPGHVNSAPRGFICIGMLAACAWGGAVARADDTPGVVLEMKFVPAARAQIAVWIERADGRFLRTLRLTEGVAYRGLGNRPGASQMNSGYRWPYGRREGILPIWAARRAAAPGAKQWKRVIFQDRIAEGLASKTSNDQSTDNYYCLSFNKMTTTRDALDAVSCASVFTSDKGRFMTDADVADAYHEPWEDPMTHAGSEAVLPLESRYPPRMDLMPCAGTTNCFDHADVALFAAHARDVMPEIDAVSAATPLGDSEQSWLFDLPSTWPRGQYVLWVEVNVEGDYNASYDASSYATPLNPNGEWDSWARDYGYAYRGQPSIAYAVPFEVAAVDDVMYTADEPEGASSWDTWADDYGKLEPLDSITDDASGAPGSGADRLHAGTDGTRIALHVQTLADLPEPSPDDVFPPDDRGDEGDSDGNTHAPGGGGTGTGGTGEPAGGKTDAGVAGAAGGEGEPSTTPPTIEPDPEGDAVILRPPNEDDAVGAVRALHLGRAHEALHAHEWIAIEFLAARSDEPLHGYDVRVAQNPIVDDASFIREGRAAKTASEDAEGAVSLVLPADVPAGQRVEAEIGDLTAQTHYYVGVRAVDRLNRRGPISVAQITTPKRVFATVTPCFVASAAYGSPLADQVVVLRRVRDRQLQTNAVGRALVRAYYERGASWALWLREHAAARSAVRAVLAPVVAFARMLSRPD
jgi:hypothetical protein